MLTASGRVSVVNKATRKILGIKEKDLQGTAIEGLLSSKGVDMAHDTASRILSGERHTWNKLKTFLMRSENMDFIGTVLVLEDVFMTISSRSTCCGRKRSLPSPSSVASSTR
jgi:hypothetical protein